MAIISPLLIMQQWHHGLTLSSGQRVGSLKNIPPRDCPKKELRTFQRMRKFCKSIDAFLNINNFPGEEQLNRLLQSNERRLIEAGILLQPRTNVGRKRSRNENGWNYIAHQYEKRLCMEKKAARDGVSFEEVREMENARERNRQKEYRRKRNEDSTDAVHNPVPSINEGTVDVSVFDRETAIATARLLS